MMFTTDANITVAKDTTPGRVNFFVNGVMFAWADPGTGKLVLVSNAAIPSFTLDGNSRVQIINQ